MADNMTIWNASRAVPKTALRTIEAGKLKGKSDINPVWRMEILTSLFGPCGFGWSTQITERWTETLETVNPDGMPVKEMACFIRLNLIVKMDGEWSAPIEGVGGSKLYGKGKGSDLDDEAWKMAETDAVSVACKKLGVAADIYYAAGARFETKYDVKPETPANKRVIDTRNISRKKTLTNKVAKELAEKLSGAIGEKKWDDIVTQANHDYEISQEQWNRISAMIKQ